MINGWTLVNDGTVNIQNGTMSTGGGGINTVITNNGTFIVGGPFGINSSDASQEIVNSSTGKFVVAQQNVVLQLVFLNDGTLQVNGTKSLTLDYGLLQDQGVTALYGGTLTVSGGFSLFGGSLQITASNVINGDLYDQGGAIQFTGTATTPAGLTVQGNFSLEQGSDGPILMTIYNDSSYDTFDITGTADINGGLLDVVFANGYTPAPGTSFDDLVMTWDASDGSGFEEIYSPSGTIPILELYGIDIQGRY